MFLPRWDHCFFDRPTWSENAWCGSNLFSTNNNKTWKRKAKEHGHKYTFLFLFLLLSRPFQGVNERNGRNKERVIVRQNAQKTHSIPHTQRVASDKLLRKWRECKQEKYVSFSSSFLLVFVCVNLLQLCASASAVSYFFFFTFLSCSFIRLSTWQLCALQTRRGERTGVDVNSHIQKIYKKLKKENKIKIKKAEMTEEEHKKKKNHM